MSAEIADFKEARAKRIEERESPATEEHLSAEPVAEAEAEAPPHEPAPRPNELWHWRQEAWATLPNGWNLPGAVARISPLARWRVRPTGAG